MTSSTTTMFAHGAIDGPPNHPLGLRALIVVEIEKNGPACNLNHLDISQMTSLRDVFMDIDFRGNVSQWDTSNIVSMASTFAKSTFNGDLSQWNVSRVEDMHKMFYKSPFNQNISRWNTRSVQTMASMFEASQFNGDISKWDISTVIDVSRMFEDAAFSGDLSHWKLPEWSYIERMFSPNFSGILPAKPEMQQPYTDAAFMMGQPHHLDAYLKRMPLNAVHAQLALHRTYQQRPEWLSQEDFQWLDAQVMVLEGLGCTMAQKQALLVAAINERHTSTMVFNSVPFSAMDFFQ